MWQFTVSSNRLAATNVPALVYINLFSIFLSQGRGQNAATALVKMYAEQDLARHRKTKWFKISGQWDAAQKWVNN